MSVEVFGSINMDIVLSVAEIPCHGVTTTASDRKVFAGGKGANQATASARFGATTSLIGAVGKDDFGAALITQLQDNNVDIENVEILADHDTGQAFINVDPAGENAIVVLPGANHALKAPEFPEADDGRQKVCLTQFELVLDEIDKYLASTKGLKIVNPAPAIIAGKKILKLADMIILNEPELAVFTHLSNRDLEDTDKIILAAKRLLMDQTKWVVVTLGARGAVAVSQDDVIAVHGKVVDVVDTTGAGDCFCGVLAAALSENARMPEALNFAVTAASLSVTKHGAGPSMPSKEDTLIAMQ